MEISKDQKNVIAIINKIIYLNKNASKIFIATKNLMNYNVKNVRLC